ncbi:MAG: ferredoxin:thioredoxin reductase [Planctomycetota bacterium]|jgi:ferredoxin-thioredoxin reductase catalytic subunit|nr:ferredoxin:thioredoxin reductase [Planctomycetota bacterium]
MESSDELSRLRARLAAHLEDRDFGFNPEPGVVDEILGAMIKRREKFGEYYCPCRVVSGDKERDAKIICPCVYHVEEIAERGFCHCRLFAS